MIQHVVFVCIYYTPITGRLTQHLFIKIHTQLHVPAMLSYPQGVYNYIKIECNNIYIMLFKTNISIFVTFS